MKIYDILGVSSNASIDEIRQAYQQKLKHIDMSRNINDYQELRDAYNQALKQIRTNETLPYEVISTSPNNSFVSEENKKMDDSSESEVKEPVVPISIEPQVTEITHETHENSFNILFMSFLNKKEFYTSFSNWEELLRPFSLNGQIPSHIKQHIKLFLLENYMLIEDSLRFKLLKLVNLTESDFSENDEDKLFREKINTKDRLDLSFYSYIPKNNRDDYFKNRYELYQVIQKGYPINSIEINTVNLLKKADYNDDDLSYLLVAYALLTPNFLSVEETQNQLNSIQKEMYLHDIEVFNSLLALIKNNQAPMVSNIDIIGLSWVSDPIKEKLMSRLKEIKRTLPKEPTIYQTTITRHTKKNHPQPFNVWKMIILFLLGITLVFGIISLLSSIDMKNSDTLDYIQNLDADDELSYENFDEIDFKKEVRESNVKIYYGFYTALYANTEPDSEFIYISENASNSLENIRDKNQVVIDSLEISDIYEDVQETHDITEDNTVITYSFFKDDKLLLKTIINDHNKIISTEEVTKKEVPKNRKLGTLDATLFFTNDISSSYGELDNYLFELDNLYAPYLTKDLYQKITEITSEEFSYLSDFTFSQPYLLSDTEKTVIALKNFADEYLFLQLNEELKIEFIYSDIFNNTPDEFIQKARKMSSDLSNPWEFDFGISL